MIVHAADFSRGRDEHDDVKFALCGMHVKLSDAKHYYGMDEQLTCETCILNKRLGMTEQDWVWAFNYNAFFNETRNAL